MSKEIKKDIHQLLSVINKVNKELKHVKKEINSKNIKVGIKTKTTSCDTTLSQNIKDYIDTQIKCKVDESLENINDKFDELETKYTKLIAKVTALSRSFRTC